MARFIHTADWQLGMTRHFLSPEEQGKFTAARIDAIDTIGTLAATKDCPFVVVCGDVFETNSVPKRVITRALEAMGSHSGCEFWLLPGNHDHAGPGSVFNSEVFNEYLPGNVKVMATSGEYVTVSGDRIIAAPWHSKRPSSDLVVRAVAEWSKGSSGDQAAKKGGGACAVIVAGHGQTMTFGGESEATAGPPPIQLREIEEYVQRGTVQYVALGDRHSTTRVGDTGRIHFSGAPEPTDFGEVDSGNALVVDVDDSKCVVDSVKIAKWEFHDLSGDLTSIEDCERFAGMMKALPNKSRTILRYSLAGQVPIHAKAWLDGQLSTLAETFAAFFVHERTSDLITVPDEIDLDEMSLSGFALEAASELEERARRPGEEAVIAREALVLLYRLSRSGH